MADKEEHAGSGSGSGSEGSGSDSDSEFVPPETLIAGRQRRATAGNRLAKLLEQEEAARAAPREEDELYKQHYGEDIFAENDDEEFTTEGEDSEDEFDSDFDSDDEGDEEDGGAAEADAEADAKAELDEIKKRKSVYVDPLGRKAKAMAKKAANITKNKKRQETAATRPADSEGAPQEKKLSAKKAFELREMADAQALLDSDLAEAAGSASEGVRRVSKRAIAVEMREYIQQQEAKRSKVESKDKKPKQESPRRTLLERLTEAINTEKENLESLQAFCREEADKKKTVLRKAVLDGPLVRFHSRKVTNEKGQPVEQALVTFTDEDYYQAVFSAPSRLAPPKKRRKDKSARPPKLPSMMKSLKEVDQEPYLDSKTAADDESKGEKDARPAGRKRKAHAADEQASAAAHHVSEAGSETATGAAESKPAGKAGRRSAKTQNAAADQGTDKSVAAAATSGDAAAGAASQEAAAASSEGAVSTRRSTRSRAATMQSEPEPLAFHSAKMGIFKTMGFAPEATVVAESSSS